LVGIGNSVFGEEMVEDHWPGTVIAVDYAKSVIQQMRSRAEEKKMYFLLFLSFSFSLSLSLSLTLVLS
jgi:ubiquinone/menaquinone biosynthesis C-methylase UbiE